MFRNKFSRTDVFLLFIIFLTFSTSLTFALEINRQIIHPRRNKNFQTPRIHFNILQSPTPNPLDLSNSTLPDTPQLLQNKALQIFHQTT